LLWRTSFIREMANAYRAGHGNFLTVCGFAHCSLFCDCNVNVLTAMIKFLVECIVHA